MMCTLVLGGPGAGKTERLLKKAFSAIESGIHPSRIALASFTKAAIDVAIARACEMFGLTPEDLPNFRTIHSFAFRELGLRRDDVLSDDHLERVSELTGELLSSLENPFSDAPAAGRQADPLLTLDHYARTTGRSLADAWVDHGSDLDWHRVLRFSRAYAQYKDDAGVLDFTDMLTRYADGPFAPLGIDLAILDEGQDLSREQWRVADKAFANAEEFVVGGDDMQMIHHWAGADEDRFLGLAKAGFAIENLPLSHRLARKPFAIAEEVGLRISKRYRRAWRPSDREGSVEWVSGPSEVDFSRGSGLPDGKTAWLLLARTRSQLPGLAKAVREQGVVYAMKGESSIKWPHVVAIRAHEALRAGFAIGREDAQALGNAAGRDFEGFEGERNAAALGYDAKPIWHDALVGIGIETREYYLSVLRRGRKLTDAPKVSVETIHGAKGAEAENVLLSTDLNYRTARAMEIDSDAEHRVFYVGLTRCRESMTIIAPRTQYGFRI